MEKVLKATYRTKNIFADGYVVITQDNFLGTFADDSLLVLQGESKTSLFLTSFNYDTDELSMHRYILSESISFEEYNSYDFFDGNEKLTLTLINEVNDPSRISYVKNRISQTQ